MPPNDRLLPGSSEPSQRPAETSDAAGGTMSLRQAFAVVRRRAKLILVLTALGAAVGLFLAAKEPAVYRASATLRLAGERRALTGDDQVASGLSRTTNPLLSLMELLRSRTVIGVVVDSLGLQLYSQTPGFSPADLAQVALDPRAAGDSVQLAFFEQEVVARRDGRQVRAPYGRVMNLGVVRFAVRSRPAVEAATLGIAAREPVIDQLISGLVITSKPETDIVNVSYTAADPRTAQQIVNMTTQAFQMLNQRWAQERSRRRREFLAEQLAQTESTLARAQAELSSFHSRQQLASSRDKLVAEQAALFALDSQREELEASRRSFVALLGRLKASDEVVRAEALRTLATIPAIVDNPVVSQLNRQLLNYQFQLDSMTTGPNRNTATNPDVVRLENMARATRQQLVDAVSSQVQALDAKVEALRAQRGRSGAAMEALPAMAEEEMRLTRRVEALAGVGDELRRDLQRAQMAVEVEAGDVDVIDRADLPYSPVLAPSTLKLTLGLAAGLVLGLILAYLLEAFNTAIRRPEDLEAMLHVPGLAVIPPISLGAGNNKRPRLRGLLSAGKADIASGSPMTTNQPFSMGIEAFRNLRTSLVWLEGGVQMKTLVVTSAAPGEGKTLTAANLAVTLAYDGFKVLLVDCDIRRPRLHGLFRVPRAPGLMELLASPHTSEDASSPRSTIRETSVAGLSLLTCGALPSNAANLLSGTRMRGLLHELQELFDIIVLDTPPVLATADAGIVASLVDGVLLVVRAGTTERGAAQRACHQLAIVGARVVGTVLNDPGGQVAKEGDYYYPYDYAAETK